MASKAPLSTDGESGPTRKADSGAAEPSGGGHPDVEPVDARPPKPAAGGWGAMAATFRHVRREMGLWHGAKVLLGLNQEDGFDCPGCAWPDPPERSRLEFCENGVKAISHEATRKRVGPTFFAEHSIPDLMARSDRWLEAQGRLTHPMVRRSGANHYEPIDWDDAFEMVGQALKGLDTPDEAIFYTSGRTSNEAAFLYQLMVRRFGTNNLPDCSNMCHESSGTGLSAVIGVGKGTVGLHDFAHAEAIFVIGQNPGTNHPRMLSTLQEAAQRGCHIVSINPLREPGLVRFKHPKQVSGLLGRGTALAECFLQVRVNGDVALLKGLMKAVFEAEASQPGEVLDHAFIERHTTGFRSFRSALERVGWETIVEHSGVSRQDIQRAAQIYIESNRTIICWAMGLTQHKNGVANIKEVVNLLLLKGNLGKPGAGACPVRGHSNVQGDRTMGIWDAPSEAFLDRLAAEFDFEPPRAHGTNTVQAIEAMHDGRAAIFVSLGGNFLLATPDTRFTADALSRCALTVQISTKLNRSHLVTGDEALILPCLARSEEDVRAGLKQFVTVENSMSLVHRSQGRFPPASEHLISEPAIVAGIAKAALGEDERFPWSLWADEYDRIRDRIANVVPGCHDYNKRVRQPAGFLLPNGARERVFDTASEKAEFSVQTIPEHDLAAGEYLMMTIRSHDQYNTTIYTNDDRYRGIYGERRVVLVNAEDLAEAGLVEGQVVDVVSTYAEVERRATRFLVVPYELPRRCVATYFPEANVLVPVDLYADGSYTPASKSVVVRLEAAVEAA